MISNKTLTNVSSKIFKKEQKITFLCFKVISQINDYSFRINTVYKKILKYLFVKRKNVLYSILLEYKNVKIVKCFAKVGVFGYAVSLRLLKIEHFSF